MDNIIVDEQFGLGRFATDYSTASRSRVTHNNFWKLVYISLTNAVTTVEIGIFSPPNAREKRQKTPYLTINCTLKLLHTLNQQQSDIYIQ